MEMLDDAQTLPDDPSRLKDMVVALAGELKFRDILIENLKHQLAGMRRHRFGGTSEALDQLALSLEEEEIATGASVPETPTLLMFIIVLGMLSARRRSRGRDAAAKVLSAD